MIHRLRLLLLLTGLLLLAACSTTKHVPQHEYLLDEVHIVTDNKEVKPSALQMYLRQHANSKWFNLFKVQLYVYNWSGSDSTKWINKAFRRMGDAPVIYNEYDTQRTRQEITHAVQNMGFMGAGVDVEREASKRKIKVTYRVTSGPAYTVRHLRRDIRDPRIAAYLQADSASTLLHPGMRFDVNVLDAERNRIVNYLQQNGYYKFNKDYISYSADTTRNTHLVDLTMRLDLARSATDTHPHEHRQYTLNQVHFVTNYDVMQSSALSAIEVNDSIHYHGLPIYYKDRLYLRPKVLDSNLAFRSGQLYNEANVQRTYANFGRFGALKYTNIRFFEVEQGDSAKLNAYLLLTPSRHQSVSLSLDGTNSAGDLGAAAAVTFNHRNIFHGSENLMLKVRGAYEAVSGLASNAHNQSYTEIGAEASINFPRFMFPFLSSGFKQKIRATSQFDLQYNYQIRPEFTRIVASAGWAYRWGKLRQKAQHRIDLIDINYLYMPWIDSHFEETYLNQEQNYILQYNYDDRLIVRTGYSFTYNSAGGTPQGSALQSNNYTIRFNAETAGNLLYAISRTAGLPRNNDDEYTLLDIPFAQYFKADIDYTRNFRIDRRNSMSFHVGLGVAIPYGNATMLPFEKRYFSGGANSVRGWSVRGLGPGTFAGDGNFMNQSGDIKFDASLEFRSHLFWKLQGAVFVDAGNIWTARNYKDQPGGQFRFNTFYKQLAAAYGIGLRLDLDFFILRFDGGMKAIDPTSDADTRFPIFKPRFSRDFAFHFAVGYPF